MSNSVGSAGQELTLGKFAHLRETTIAYLQLISKIFNYSHGNQKKILRAVTLVSDTKKPETLQPSGSIYNDKQ